jgi:hypothetical protein
VEKLILETVNTYGPINGSDLTSKVLTEMYKNDELLQSFFSVEYNTVSEILDDLVTHGQIVEVEYVLPGSTDRIRSMYFPAKTEINVVH